MTIFRHGKWPPRAVDSREEAVRIRRQNVQQWIYRHHVPFTVDQILERVGQVGEEVAMAEARAGNLPNVPGERVESDHVGRSSPDTSGQDIRPPIAVSPRRVSPRGSELLQSPEGADDDEW